jgi:hypothetical protein
MRWGSAKRIVQAGVKRELEEAGEDPAGLMLRGGHANMGCCSIPLVYDESDRHCQPTDDGAVHDLSRRTKRNRVSTEAGDEAANEKERDDDGQFLLYTDEEKQALLAGRTLQRMFCEEPQNEWGSAELDAKQDILNGKCPLVVDRNERRVPGRGISLIPRHEL